MGELSSAFNETKEGQSVCFVLAGSQVPLIQKNQYAKVAYFREAYSAPFQPENVKPENDKISLSLIKEETLSRVKRNTQGSV